MKHIPILKTLNRVPGGLMIVPLFLGAIVNTLFPQVLEIGSFTTALFKDGAMALIAVLLLCSGAQITFESAGIALWKGVVLNGVKVGVGALVGILIAMFAGSYGSFAGLSVLAIISAMTNSNGGLYGALASKYGDATDVGALAIVSTNDGPFFTMIAMGLSGLASIPIIALVAVVVPIIVGMILGNLDDEIRKFLAPGVMISIPLFSFPLGAQLNLIDIARAGLPGIMLGLMTCVITGLAGYIGYKLLIPKKWRSNDAVGCAIGTSAGNAVITPAAVAAVDPRWAPYVATATVHVSASIVITAFLTPLLVDFLSRHNKKSKDGTIQKQA